MEQTYTPSLNESLSSSLYPKQPASGMCRPCASVLVDAPTAIGALQKCPAVYASGFGTGVGDGEGIVDVAVTTASALFPSLPPSLLTATVVIDAAVMGKVYLPE